MKIALPVAVMFTPVLILILGREEAHNPEPCLRNPDNNAYNKFVRKHILQESFRTASKTSWERYLRNNRLCDRRRQSFIREEDRMLVVQTCNGHGKRLEDNLCTSTSSTLVYDLRVNTATCKVRSLQQGSRYVVLACDKVANRCRPVHYEKSVNRPPSSGDTCRP